MLPKMCKQLPVLLEDLKTEKKRTESHMESIKKRQANLNVSEFYF